MSDHKVTIGQIVAPHGVRGDVRVIPLTDFPERFKDLKKALLDDGTSLVVTGVKYHKQFVLLKFKGLDSVNDVEKLRGKLLHVEKKDAVKLPEGHFYLFDIIGLKAYTDEGEYLGTITDVLKTGSNDVYVAEQQGQKPVLIPALKKVVLNIDINNGKMIVKLQEEWD